MKNESTKIERFRRMLARKRGATVGDLMRLTGWNERTVARRLAQLRKEGVPIQRDREERRGSVYHAVSA